LRHPEFRSFSGGKFHEIRLRRPTKLWVQRFIMIYSGA
jgi:hypothetical protein